MRNRLCHPIPGAGLTAHSHRLSERGQVPPLYQTCYKAQQKVNVNLARYSFLKVETLRHHGEKPW